MPSKPDEPPGGDVAQSATALPGWITGVGHSSRFAHVDCWVFDLDNTLYSADSDLWPQIDDRITRYLSNLFGLDGLSARALQKYYYQRYGTTLHGLIAEHQIDHAQFLDFVHDIDRSRLPPNPGLASAIAALPGRKLVLTNGSREHAVRTVEQLGLAPFEDVFDIVAAELTPKPDPLAYERFFARHGVEPTKAAMFEDIARNLEVPHRRGMVTTLILPPLSATDHREPWERLGATEPYVDFVTENLTDFLAGIMRPTTPETAPLA